MRPFRFCPSCGSSLDTSGSDPETTCTNCGETWYRNPAPTVGCVLLRDGRALISRRGSEPFKGRFDVPGGFLEPGEEAIEGLKREIKEELKIEISTSMADCLQIEPHRYGPDGDWTLAIGFKGTIVRGEPEPSDDVDAIEWVSESELESLDFAWQHDRELVRKALADG
ncbi:MAG: NUDIX domain-containing protein [Actinomycetota bacterium]